VEPQGTDALVETIVFYSPNRLLASTPAVSILALTKWQ